MTQFSDTRSYPQNAFGKATKMMTRAAFLSLIMSTTALVSATAQTAPVASNAPSVTQNMLRVGQVEPKLNIGLAHGGFNAISGQVLTFKTYWNYDGFIARADVLVYHAHDTEHRTPLDVLPVSKGQPTVWTPHGDVGDGFVYVLRAYGHDGVYDETRPRLIRISDQALSSAEASPSVVNIFRQDNTASRQIRLPGVAPMEPVEVDLAEVTPVAAVADVQPALYALAEPEAAVPNPTETRSPFTVRIDEDTASNLVLSPDDIHMSYDGLSAQPLLNAGLADGKGSAAPGETLEFRTFWNYSHWVERAELRIFDEDDQLITAPVAVLNVDLAGNVVWTVPASVAGKTYSYVLRVYDADGRFDETARKTVLVTDKAKLDEERLETTAIYGQDNTSIRNIAVNGGSVTVSMADIGAYNVDDLRVFGYPVPIDPDGDFAVQQILPSGAHDLAVSYVDGDGRRVQLKRQIDIPANEFFFVGLGDLTVGRQGEGGRALVEAGGEDFDQTFVHGRAAFYLKGKVQGKYLITASLDTTEDDISNIFSNLNDRDPQSLLRRLDPDRFYPVYGDDSTFVEDAPTQGRFYVRVEKGDDHIVWGNFLTNITSTEFAQIDRGLYGAKLEYNSDATTSTGERRSRVTLFAADPGTVPGRDEFRGTGGSVFFFQRQDLTIGSERLRIEIRDKDSGLVLETRDLRPFVDYDVDYIQGRVILAEPLNSTVLGDQIVRDGTISGGDAYLVARYEFTPGLADIGGFTTGGRAEGWVTDNVRLGFTGQQEETGDVDQTLYAADLLVRASEGTYFKAEVANTEGQAFGESASLDGGFTFADLASADVDSNSMAYRFEGAVNLADVSNQRGSVSAYYEDIEAGFSAPGRLAIADTERYGAAASVQLSEDGRTNLALKYDSVDIDGGVVETTTALDARLGVTEAISVGLGVRYNDIEGSAIGRNGDRTDIGGEVRYNINDENNIYVFAQGTVANSGTIAGGDRYGAGARVQLTERIGVNGEVSGGNGGLGALGGLSFQRADGEEYYLNYTLDAERTEPGVDGTRSLLNSQNTLTAGGRKRFTSYLSVFGEERRSFGNTAGLTHAYGLDFTPGDHWSFGANFEIGEVEDQTQIVDREAFTVTTGYTSERFNAGAAFEWRDDTNNGESRESWSLRSNASLQISEDFRGLLRFNRAESNSSEGAFFDGEFTEIQVAGAYRPTKNDRLNALLRYTYFEDQTSASQISNSGQSALPAQRSNIFSLDAQYRLTNWLTIGGKYGVRTGEISVSRLSDDFVSSTAQLGVIRADIHFVKKWDLLLEGRILDVQEASDTRSGLLAAVYRHVGDNAKIGVGYNFTDFSDDLTDLSFDDNGVFVNLIAKF